MTVLIASPASAQDPIVTAHGDPPPAELAEPIKALLTPGGQLVTIGATKIQFWWVKSLPLAAGSADPATWKAVTEGTTVGAVRLLTPHSDIRGRNIKAGVYTLRYGIQPNNGDHLGVSPFRDFLLLTPATLDTDPAPVEHDPLAERSGKSIGSSHPAAWSLDPPVSSEEPMTVHTNEAGHKGVVFQVPVSRDGKDAGALRFGLILVGEIDA